MADGVSWKTADLGLFKVNGVNVDVVRVDLVTGDVVVLRRLDAGDLGWYQDTMTKDITIFSFARPNRRDMRAECSLSRASIQALEWRIPHGVFSRVEGDSLNELYNVFRQ